MLYKKIKRTQKIWKKELDEIKLKNPYTQNIFSILLKQLIEEFSKRTT